METEKSIRIFDFNTDFYINNDDSSSNDEHAGFKQDKQTFNIQVFGKDETGASYCLFVEGFTPFFYVKVGNHWGQAHKAAFLACLKKKAGRFYENSIVECKLIKRKKLYMFDNGLLHNFVLLKFSSMGAFYKIRNIWYNEDKKLHKNGVYFQNAYTELYESNIPPLLRFFHIQNISPSGWVCFSLKKTREVKYQKKSNCDHEYCLPFDALVAQNDKELQVPLKICSFDIEASSSHGDFPIPVKSYKKLATQIVDKLDQMGLNKETVKDAVAFKATMKTWIMGAFGFLLREEENGIDLVYPKRKVTMAEVEQLFEEWFATRVKKNQIDYETLTIETCFEKVGKELASNKEEKEKVGDNEDVDGDSDDEDDKDDGGIIEEEERPAWQNKKTESDIRKMKLLDYKTSDLLLEKIERNEKINQVNVVLNQVFPKLEGDKVTYIGSSFLRLGEKEPYLNHCAVLGSCANVDGVAIQPCNSEKDVLLAWRDIMQRENPDIVIGYNIFGFDYEFMFRRAEETGCVDAFLQLSKNGDEVCGKKNAYTNKYAIEETSIHIASGQHDLKYIKMPGRVQIDLYNFFRREENLPSYKLDYVSGHFIGDYIKKAEYDSGVHLTTISSGNLTGLSRNTFIHFEEIGHSTEYVNGGAKYRVIDVDRGSCTFVIEGRLVYNEGKKVRWGLAKDDVSPKDIFQMFLGTDEDRAVIAKYCIQDCVLVHHLMRKVDIWTGYTEMAKICSVPIHFLVLRGQGIKLTSYVAKKCREKGVLMPVIEKSEENDGYEGAIVLDPKCDLYLDNPVACVDYASLYPSSMMSENISHDSKVWTKEYDLDGNCIAETGSRSESDSSGVFIYDNLPGVEYVDIRYDTYQYIRKTEKAAAEKVKVGYKICRYAQPQNGVRAIMPSILEELLGARKATRKLIPLEKDEFMKNVLDKRQLGYKVTANSLYGQCGAKTSSFYDKDCAASTTATGRLLLTYAKKIIETCYNGRICETETQGPVLTKAEYIYGDSVARDTPVLVSTMVNGQRRIDLICIESLAEKYGNGVWKTYHHSDGISLKEVCEFDLPLYSWTETGWTQIQHIIRHKLAPHKKMIRIVSGSAVVDVTDDHSLLRKNGDMVSPKDVSIGTELLHKDCVVDMRDCKWLESVPYCKKTYAYDARKKCLLKYLTSVEGQIINCQNLENDGKNEKIVCYFKSHENELAAEVAFTAQQVFGFLVDIDFAQNNSNVKKMTIYTKLDETEKEKEKEKEKYKNNGKIIKMKEIAYHEDAYVYDLTTDNHHFAAGIGNMIVHNTDSVFFTFNLMTADGKEKIRGKKALEITIELAQEAGHLASMFLKQPHDLEYEKTFMPFCLLSKKRYVGMLYETDPNKGKRKEMGIVLKRRDNAPIVKDVYGGIIDILMKEQNLEKALDYLRTHLRDLVDGKIPMEKCIISKSLRSGYKNPKSIAHKVLADRMTARDPGNKPGPGDRIPYVYIVNPDKKALQGEKIETPAFVLQSGLKIDYSFYITNQIMKPVQQLFSLVLDQIWELQNKKAKRVKFMKELDDWAIKIGDDKKKLDKKVEVLKNKEVKMLLFDEFLESATNTKKITSYFS